VARLHCQHHHVQLMSVLASDTRTHEQIRARNDGHTSSYQKLFKGRPTLACVSHGQRNRMYLCKHALVVGLRSPKEHSYHLVRRSLWVVLQYCLATWRLSQPSFPAWMQQPASPTPPRHAWIQRPPPLRPHLRLLACSRQQSAPEKCKGTGGNVVCEHARFSVNYRAS
jgi:hypothetical protein